MGRCLRSLLFRPLSHGSDFGGCSRVESSLCPVTKEIRRESMFSNILDVHLFLNFAYNIHNKHVISGNGRAYGIPEVGLRRREWKRGQRDLGYERHGFVSHASIYKLYDLSTFFRFLPCLMILIVPEFRNIVETISISDLLLFCSLSTLAHSHLHDCWRTFVMWLHTAVTKTKKTTMIS